ncbi:MAG: hypothetical protein ACE5K4_07125, partial [Candidatus Hydrothermarchaeota archaeon]
MGSWKKIMLIFDVVLTLAIIAFVISFVYSAKQISVETGEPQMQSNVYTRMDEETNTLYTTGVNIIRMPMKIRNGGFFDQNWIISSKVEIISCGYGPELSGKEIGYGHTIIGRVPAGKTKEINITHMEDASYWMYLNFYGGDVKY